MKQTEQKPLHALALNESGVVSEIAPECQLRSRLRSLGLCEGVRVTAVLRSPFGDPVAYEADGVLLALRKRDCEGITVQTEGGL